MPLRGVWTRGHNKGASADPRRRPRGHRDGHNSVVFNKVKTQHTETWNYKATYFVHPLSAILRSNTIHLRSSWRFYIIEFSEDLRVVNSAVA